MNKTNIFICIILILISFFVTSIFQSTCKNTMTNKITSAADAIKLFPITVSAIKQRQEAIINDTKQKIDAIIALNSSERNFENTIQAFDIALANFGREQSVFNVISNVNPDQLLREAADEAIIALQQFGVDYVSQNVDLYHAIKDYAENKMLVDDPGQEVKYFVSETLKDFKRSGLDLPKEKRDVIAQLKKDIAELSLSFDKNINIDKSSIQVTKEELSGLDQDFINNLTKIGDKYELGTDYPTYFQVMEQCDNASTREKLFHAFVNRANPQNVQLLEQIIEKRDLLAKELGFESYAALDIDSQMVKTDRRAKQFLMDLLVKVNRKEEQEFSDLIKDLPSSVRLVNNAFNPWDRLYAKTYYKKKYFDIDEVKLAEYFPMEHTIQALLDIYQKFFSLEFKEIPMTNIWDKEVKLIEVWRNYDNQKTLYGYLFLDLYPRPNKFTHACQMTVIPVTKKGSTIQPGVAVVLANFPKSTATKPSLLKRSDVKTFFHEFGHALHALLGATELANLSGTQVKMDFVEMPSQMLEEWLFDKEILKIVSHHYQTGQPLSDDLIDRIIEIKNFTTGDTISKQIMYALLSLAYYQPGARKDSTQILHDLQKEIRRHDVFYPHDHMQASFGHLTGYGPKYYSYLWSQVFALDLFDTIRKLGLLNPQIGNEYIQKIIGKGGSEDPNQLLYDFLGREPNQEAFLRDLGLEK